MNPLKRLIQKLFPKRIVLTFVLRGGGGVTIECDEFELDTEGGKLASYKIKGMDPDKGSALSFIDIGQIAAVQWRRQ